MTPEKSKYNDISNFKLLLLLLVFFFLFVFPFFLKNNSNDKNNDKNIFLMSHCEIKFSNHSSIQRGPEELKVKTSKQLKVREDVHDKVWRLASASD